MAINSLGVMYANGCGAVLKKDEDQSLRLYEKAAEAGVLPAISNLSSRYASGRGVPKDDAKAVRFLKQAADGGYPPAMRQLADRYLRGIGVPKDEEMAVRLLRGAAAAKASG